MSHYKREFTPRGQQRAPPMISLRKIGTMPCSQVLTPVALMFTENWCNVDGDPEYMELIIKCLRSLQAIASAGNIHCSESRRQYI